MEFLKNKLYIVFLISSCSAFVDLKDKIDENLGAGSDTSSLTITANTSNNFGSVLVGETSNPLVFTISNNGLSSALIDVDSIENLLNTSLNFTGNTYPGLNGSCREELGPDLSCKIELTFTASSLGTFESELQIPYIYNSQNLILKFTVSGTGINIDTKEILSFTIAGVSGEIEGTNITVNLPYGFDITNLTPTISINGASVSPSSGLARNFTNPVTYTVTASDTSTLSYLVTVIIAPSNANEILSFTIDGVSGEIEGTNITVNLPYGFDITNLAPNINISGVSVSPSSGLARNFTNPVTYTVTASDTSTLSYLVTVIIAPSNENEILTFNIAGQNGATVIDNNAETIILTVPYSFNINSLVATFSTSGVSVKVGTTLQTSGVSSNDFSEPLIYTVTAADTSSKNYEVTVNRAAPLTGDKQIFSGAAKSFNLIYITGGLSYKKATNNSIPVTVPNSFWIGETEVTRDMWTTVRTWANSNGYNIINAGFSFGLQAPGTLITWRDVIVWLNALTEWYNAQNGTNLDCVYYSDAAFTTPLKISTNSAAINYTLGSEDFPYVKTAAKGFRMLKAEEWELAARYKGANSSNGAYEYPVASGYWWTPGTYVSGASAIYSNVAATDEVAWYMDNSLNTAYNVCLKTKNLLGLCDMSGNAWEWIYETNLSPSQARIGASYNNVAISLCVGQPSVSYGGNQKHVSVGFRIGKNGD